MARVPIGGDELTAAEELLVQNTTALAAAGANQFLRKTGTSTVEHAAPSGSSGITSLNGLTGATQTFAKTDDTNVTLTITSSTTTHTFALGWTGTLSVARGGTGAGDAATARSNLGAAAASHTHTLADITDDGALAAKNTIATSDIDNDAVTYAKIQNVSATDKILGRQSAGAGDIEEITCTAAGRALIDDTDAAAQRTTLGLGALAVLATVGTSQIDNDAVTYAKIQNVSATARLLGRNTAGAGDIEELDASTVKTMLSLNNVENTALSTWAGSANITTLGTVTTGTWSATAIGATKGGTGQTSWATGDLLYASATDTLAKLSGNTTTTKKFLSQTGTGSASQAPVWAQPAETDLTFTDVTTNNVSTTKHGFAPKLPNDATKYLDGTGAYSTPSSGGDKTVTALPGWGTLVTPTLVRVNNEIPAVRFANGANDVWSVSVKVPSGCTSISSIKVIYKRSNTGNLYLKFLTGHIDTDTNGSSVEEDTTDTYTTYAGGANDGTIGLLTVPSGAYDGLTNIDADDLISIRVDRDAANASDTYEANWDVLGVQFVFA